MMPQEPTIVERVIHVDLYCVYDSKGDLVAAFPDRASADARLWIEQMS